MMDYKNSLKFAQQQDANDPLAHFRNEFHTPRSMEVLPCISPGILWA